MGQTEDNDLNSDNGKIDGIKKASSTTVEPNGTELTSVEGKTKKLPYPKSIGFIISNEFCERFMYYGMRTILVLYLTSKLDYNESTATVIYHIFGMLVYFLCVFGAIISDSFLGKFKTILILSIVYAIGIIIISLGAMPQLYLPGVEMTILGLFLVALGSGGIKPCVAAFGGDQFQMPEQAKQMATFFSLFYFSINAGSLISTSITPILRQDVHCFGDTDCYSLAFGVPGVLMIVSIIIFVCGRFMYKVKPPSGNMVVLVSKCIGNAIATRAKERKSNPREHWLDYAETKYGKQLVADTKVLLKILLLYIPLPVFWALFDQQGSRWTFQATRMDGVLGTWEIKPDQMQVFNPLLILVFIPLYDVAFYPLLAKVGIRRPLQKLTMGGILAGIAFLLSAIVELQLEPTYPVLPGIEESQLRIYNGLPCEYRGTTSIPDHGTIVLNAMSAFEEKYVHVTGPQSFSYDFLTTSSQCPEQFTGNFNLKPETAMGYHFQSSGVLEFEDDPNKSNTGEPVVRLLIDTPTVQSLNVRYTSNGGSVFTNDTSFTGRIGLLSTEYDIYINNASTGVVFDLKTGVVKTIMIRGSGNSFTSEEVIIAAANSLHMLWLVPQYVVMTLGEVMYSVTGLEFSYSQAPVSMKAVLQACWLLTVAFGNVIVVIVAGTEGMSSQANEFFLFAGLMFVDMILFALLAWRYKSVPAVQPEEEALVRESTDDDNKTLDLADAETKDFKKDGNGLANPSFEKD